MRLIRIEAAERVGFQQSFSQETNVVALLKLIEVFEGGANATGTRLPAIYCETLRETL